MKFLMDKLSDQMNRWAFMLPTGLFLATFLVLISRSSEQAREYEALTGKHVSNVAALWDPPKATLEELDKGRALRQIQRARASIIATQSNLVWEAAKEVIDRLDRAETAEAVNSARTELRNAIGMFVAATTQLEDL